MIRPRNPDADAAILAAAGQQLWAGGYDSVSVDRIAADAGVAKTTVYRRWPTKDHLIVSVLAAWQQDVPMEAAGDLRAKLLSTVGALAATIDPPPMRRLVAELAAAAAREPGLREQASALWAARRAQAADALAPQLLRPEADLALDMLVGPLYYRVLITDAPLDDAFVVSLVDAVLRSLQRREAGSDRPDVSAAGDAR